MYQPIRRMDRISGILYINLDCRVDRRTHIESELARMKMNPSSIQRVPAIHNNMCGHLGCGQSHIRALDIAITNNWDRVMILEDDFHFDVDPEELRNFLEEADQIKWDVLLLAKGHSILEEHVGRLRKVLKSTTTSGYIVHRRYYAVLRATFAEAVEQMKEGLSRHIESYAPETAPKYSSGVPAIDMAWRALQRKGNFYIGDPIAGHQGGFGSDT